MKISSFIVSLVIVGLFASVFGLYYSGLANNYGTSYNESNFESYNKIQTIQEQVQSIEEGIDTDETEQGITDLVGGFLKKGFAVLKVTFQSFDLFSTMSTDATEQVEREAGIDLRWVTYPLITVAFIIFLFLIISVLVGREV